MSKVVLELVEQLKTEKQRYAELQVALARTLKAEYNAHDKLMRIREIAKHDYLDATSQMEDILEILDA